MSFEQPSSAPSPANVPTTATAHQNNGQSDAPARPWPATTTTLAALKPAATTTSSPAPPTIPSFGSGFSASTEEILRRVSANASAHAGTPGWEAAREQVLRSMVTSDKIPTPPPMATGKRVARRGSRSALASSTPLPEGAAGAAESSATPASAASATSARGRGGARGRGRGGARGGKRKRADTPDSEDDSDISSSYTPLPTKTKSGRNVTKPTQFTPVLPSPSTATRKKRAQRRPAETSVCKVCQRGHSPTSNMIVFCDGCNTGYHQYCHHPPIEREVIQVAEKEWFCGACTASKKKQDDAIPSVTELVAGVGLSREEKRAYFDTLSATKLAELLLHATDIQPNLPVFSPNARSLFPVGSLAAQFNANTLPGASMAPNTNTDGATIQPNHTSFNHNTTITNTAQSLNMPLSTTAPQVQPPHAAIPPPEPDETEPDPYGDGDGYDTDPPAHYPKPGNGLARTLRPESEDLQWLVDDNLEVFSHVYNNDGQATLNGFGADGAMDLTGTGAAAAP